MTKAIGYEGLACNIDLLRGPLWRAAVTSDEDHIEGLWVGFEHVHYEEGMQCLVLFNPELIYLSHLFPPLEGPRGKALINAFHTRTSSPEHGVRASPDKIIWVCTQEEADAVREHLFMLLLMAVKSYKDTRSSERLRELAWMMQRCSTTEFAYCLVIALLREVDLPRANSIEEAETWTRMNPYERRRCIQMLGLLLQ